MKLFGFIPHVYQDLVSFVNGVNKACVGSMLGFHEALAFHPGGLSVVGLA